jgi:MFS superfamily sulfate permease-like transporter
LIVIVLGCIKDFGGNGFSDGQGPGDFDAYRACLAVGVVAAVLQILFGLFRAGILSEFFPKSAIHGMLSAIGVIIIAKQIPNALGVSTDKQEPLELLAEIPHMISEANPAIASIGILSLGLLALWPTIKKKLRAISAIPPQLIVLVVAVLIGLYLNLLENHQYKLFGHEYKLGDQYLVPLPSKMFGIVDQITLPDFGVLKQWVAWKWVGMFFIIGSLESILSAKAIDSIDPWKRKTDMNRDLLAVGTANVVVAAIGGLPMISEIVRSKANIDAGARTRFADLWHGLFLLAFVAFAPGIIHMIPLSALAAMLVYTGARLASPKEFLNVFRIGPEQLVIFVTTIIAVLLTDLLIGVGIGIALKFVIHAANGVPLNSFFKPFLQVTTLDDQTVQIEAAGSAVFSNWLPFRRQIVQLGLLQGNDVVVNLAGTRLVDHSVMEKLEELSHDCARAGRRLEVVGLDDHRGLSKHPHATRRRPRQKPPA